VTSEVIGTIWVRLDCLFAREGDGSPDPPDRDPWGEISTGYSVTLGMLAAEHACGRQNGEDVEECDCEITTFSWSHCEGCGSTLGGERHAYTLWKENGECQTN
jgi:hypothetical protein